MNFKEEYLLEWRKSDIEPSHRFIEMTLKLIHKNFENQKLIWNDERQKNLESMSILYKTLYYRSRYKDSEFTNIYNYFHTIINSHITQGIRKRTQLKY